MSIFKCKMCGGNVIFDPGSTVGECDSCGTKQTLPKTEDDQVTNLFNRANNLRMKCEFDKAEAIYKKIVEKDDSEAEAHWGIVLCKYGIEYVEDPKTGKRLPTCHRTLFDAVTADPDYQAAVDYAEVGSQSLYESEARAIDRIQKDILAIVKNEKPFDVFICYKETDENGKRTVDSTIANDIYYQLTQEGFKVFYAAITLEDKLGQEYEPYIFAALNSAKVMLVVGTKPEYFNAVWVKNEWSRYLHLMKTDRSKLLIPCYRDMDAYELPEEFAHLQAQDMSKIGFINDVTRGIKKVLETSAPKVETREVKETVVVNNGSGAGTAPLLKRAFMFLEDGKWQEADEYCEKVLDQDPENAQAYLGKLMSEKHVKTQECLKDCKEPFANSEYCKKAIRFGDEKLTADINAANDFIIKRNEEQRLEDRYQAICRTMAKAKTEPEYVAAMYAFESMQGYKDSKQKAELCRKSGEEARKDEVFAVAVNLRKQMTIDSLQSAISKFESISDWRDSNLQIEKCRQLIETIKESTYRSAIELKNKNTISDTEQAINIFESIIDWKDSKDQTENCRKQIESIRAEAEQRLIKEEKKAKRRAIIVTAILLVIASIGTVIGIVSYNNTMMQQALARIESGESNISGSEFFSFMAKKGWYQNGALTIPDGVTSIGSGAFMECIGLTSITIPDSVTSIGDDAFTYCTGLRSITIPDSVTSIGEHAFSNCTGLTSITIPDSVTSIGRDTFCRCTGLMSITIPDSVTSIGISAFWECTSLTSITIPDSVTSIGAYAFSGCTGLKGITIPNSVTSIGFSAFSGCTGLTSITIPGSVTYIGSREFDYCTNLTIYCEAAEEPSGWDSTWNFSHRPVVWGYTGY